MSSTPLHDACKKNKVSPDVILELLNYGPDDVMKKDLINGRLPIHYACEQGQSYEVIDALIKAYPDGPEVRDGDGWLPIHEACANGQSFEVIDALIKAHPYGLRVPNNNGHLPIHVACGVKGQSFEVIDALIKAYPDGLRVPDNKGHLPIHWACAEGSFEVIDALIKAYPDGPKVPNNKGRMPIHYACAKGQSFEVIDALIKAYPDGPEVRDGDGSLPIHYACAQGQSFEVIKSLIKAYPYGLRVQDGDGSLPIHWACAQGQSFEVIKFLTKYYPYGLRVQDNKGRMPIHWACAEGQNFEVIDALIKEYRDGLKFPDGDGSLPIHWACARQQSVEVIDALIKEYPDGLKFPDGDGTLPIHWACARQQSFEVIDALITEYPDGLKVRDNERLLPIHWACAEGQSFEVIEALIDVYPEALGKKSEFGRTPFEWDYEESCGGHFKEFIQHLFPARGADAENEEKDRRHKRILTHCKNYVPVDILRIGFLDEKTLESHSFTEWLNGMLCRRSVVFMMVLEFYLHMAWIYTFVSASHIYFVESGEPLGWRPTALRVFAAMFLLEEMSQFIRLYFTGESLHYCTNWWNWIDVVTCVMVIVAAVRFLDEDSSIDGHLLMTTGCLQCLLLLSYLKKTFFPFSKFVSGVIKIIWAVLPFLVVSVVTLFTFSFMYFVQDQDDKLKNTNNSNLEDNASTGDLDVAASLDSILSLLDDKDSFASLMLSFQTVFDKFAGGAKESFSALDFFFGIIVVIVLLNVVIAVVSDEWAKADAEANASFWSYRFDLIIEKTRGLSLCTSYYNEVVASSRTARLPVPALPAIEISADWKWAHYHEDNWGGHLDEIFINKKTVGTTMEGIKMKLAVKNKEDGMFASFKLRMECFVFFVLGFPTFGLLWPKFIRQMLFTPTKPKESSDADSERKRETFEREIANEVSMLSKKVVGQNELLVEYKKDQDESLAEYKQKVSELSQKVSAQNDLLEQLLKKVS